MAVGSFMSGLMEGANFGQGLKGRDYALARQQKMDARQERLDAQADEDRSLRMAREATDYQARQDALAQLKNNRLLTGAMFKVSNGAPLAPEEQAVVEKLTQNPAVTRYLQNPTLVNEHLAAVNDLEQAFASPTVNTREGMQNLNNAALNTINTVFSDSLKPKMDRYGNTDSDARAAAIRMMPDGRIAFEVDVIPKDPKQAPYRAPKTSGGTADPSENVKLFSIEDLKDSIDARKHALTVLQGTLLSQGDQSATTAYYDEQKEQRGLRNKFAEADYKFGKDKELEGIKNTNTMAGKAAEHRYKMEEIGKTAEESRKTRAVEHSFSIKLERMKERMRRQTDKLTGIAGQISQLMREHGYTRDEALEIALQKKGSGGEMVMQTYRTLVEANGKELDQDKKLSNEQLMVMAKEQVRDVMGEFSPARGGLRETPQQQYPTEQAQPDSGRGKKINPGQAKALLARNGNDPEKAMKEAKKLGYTW